MVAAVMQGVLEMTRNRLLSSPANLGTTRGHRNNQEPASDAALHLCCAVSLGGEANEVLESGGCIRPLWWTGRVRLEVQIDAG